MPLSSHRQFDAALDFAATSVERTMDRLLPSGETGEARVFDAMRYASLGGGKRLRAFFVLASATLFRVSTVSALRTASAIEFVHAYSLVHDDLPAMDDDDLRRGRPTVHKAFDEATAILAGDALLTEAFRLLADPGCHPDADVRVSLVAALAAAAGAGGMVGGQMRDIEGETVPLDRMGILTMQAMKTGALFAAAIAMGAILGRADAAARAALADYGRAAGQAFQLADDLLDITATPATLGKATGKDAGAGKQTLVALLGEERARQQLGELVHDALTALLPFGERAASLRETVIYIATRDR